MASYWLKSPPLPI